MDNSLKFNGSAAGEMQREVSRLPYHAPAFKSLGAIQTLVRSGNGGAGDGTNPGDGNAS